jgi:DNA-binding transcriptional LysR family regulator
MRVTLGQLKAFEAVARLGSFSGAGKELFITQPAVSKKVRQLQDEVGLPLIEQVGKQLYLTDAGRLLLGVCTDWLTTWSQFEQSIADLQGLKRGRLKIAVVTTSKYFMPRVLGPFCARYPGIDVAMEVVNRDRLLERLARNEDDLYVMGVPPDDIDIISRPLIDNTLVVVGPASHPLTRRRRVRFAELADQVFLMREQGSGTRIAIERLFEEKGIPLKVKMELGSNEAIKQAVAGGLGLAIMSRHAINTLSGNEGVIELNVQGFPLRRHWYVVTPAGRQLSVVATTFIEFLDEHIKLLEPMPKAGD